MDSLPLELYDAIILPIIIDGYYCLCLVNKQFHKYVQSLARMYKVFQVHQCMKNPYISKYITTTMGMCDALTFHWTHGGSQWLRLSDGTYILDQFTYATLDSACSFITRMYEIMQMVIPDYIHLFKLVDARKCCSCDKCKYVIGKFPNITPKIINVYERKRGKYIVRVEINDQIISGYVNTYSDHGDAIRTLGRIYVPSEYGVKFNGNYRYLLKYMSK